MSITIGSNNISGSGDIGIKRSGSTPLSYGNFGKLGEYPSFSAGCTDANWRYGAQMGGAANWRAASTWPNATWAVDQRGAGSYGFDTTNGRYYAPVTGYYMFGMVMYYGNETNDSQGYTHVNFRKNGQLNFNSSRHGHSIFCYVSESFYANGIQMENVVPMNQGDYIEPSPYWAASYSRLYCGYFRFFGHLIN